MAAASLALVLIVAAPAGSDGMAARGATDPATSSEIVALYAAASAAEARFFARGGAHSAEAAADLAVAARLFERIVQQEDSPPHAHWRAARATWLLGESLPLEASERRLVHFRRALTLSDRGLEADPECAGCMLWKFTAMGRVRTTEGIWTGIRQVPEMAELLDRGIELQPSYRDGDRNSTLGNLHYSSAIFYRLVPEWWWIRWIIGVKGDKDRALAHSRAALLLHPNRLDYQIEVATQLLCIGTSRGDDTSLQAGLDDLRVAVAREAQNPDDAREIRFGERMLEQPEIACSYSGDQILELDERSAREASS